MFTFVSKAFSHLKIQTEMKVAPICLVLQGPGAQFIESSFKKIIGV